MSGISDEEYHHLLVHQNRERIELAATQAFEQQLENPVVLLLDMDDPVARAIDLDPSFEGVACTSDCFV